MSLVGFGAGLGAGRFGSPTSGRLRNGSGMQGVSYPSPFLDIAHTYLPTTIKQLFRWCRYYFMTSPLINAVVFKLSEYPITDVIVDCEDEAIRKRWMEYLNDALNINAFRVEVGLDYNTYGSSFSSVSFPFKKHLHCANCKFQDTAERLIDKWTFTNFQFRLTCPKCNQVGDATVQDVYYKNASGIRMIRWNAEDIEVDYNEITGDFTHYYSIPAPIRNDLVIGKKDRVKGVPQVYIRAMKEMKGVIFSKDNFFQMRRPTLAGVDRGWGMPLLLPVLKDQFYQQIMKKAQEAILLQRIVPLDVIFPQSGSGSSDVYSSVNLVDWRDHVAQEIARWKQDQNYIPILPLPIGHQTIGGDGRALMLTGELQAMNEQIVAGMGIPRELIFGGASYSGSNVSLRMLENMFLGYIQRQRQLVRFIVKQIAWFLDWPMVNIRFKPFKMADDIQRKAYRFQLNQANKISDTTLLADDDLSQIDENQIMIRETDMRLEATRKQQLAMADVQGESQLVMMKYQVKGQEVMMKAQQAPLAPGEPGAQDGQMGAGAMTPEMAAAAGMPVGPPPPAGPSPQDFLAGMSSQLSGGQRISGGNMNVDLPAFAMAQAKTIVMLSPQQQELALQNLQAQSPELADLVRQYLGSLSPPGKSNGSSNGAGAAGVDMRAMPDKLPPRRQNPTM